MARNYLQFSVDAWRDRDWTSLTAQAQWLYVLILSQPKLSLVGGLDVNLNKWATMCADAESDDVAAALDELEQERFVIVDPVTQELIVRSFTKNDLKPSRLSPQIVKGFWGAWKGLHSPILRMAVVDNCPDAVWDRIAAHAPLDAQNRRSRPIDWEGHSPIDWVPPSPIDSPATCYLLPEASSQQPVAPETAAAAQSDERPAALSDRERTDRFHEAIEVLVQRTVRRKPAESNPTGYERALRLGKRTDHAARAMALIDAHPDIDPADLADQLEPTPSATTRPGDDSVQRRRAFELLSNPPCDRCHGTTWLDAPLLDDDTWGPPEPCPDCNPEARSA